MTDQPTDSSPSLINYIVFAGICSVALYDMGVGLYLLFSETPELVNGAGTVWTELNPPFDQAILSLFRRMGAFSFFAGLTTVTWAYFGLKNKQITSILLIIYMIAGLFFFYTDTTFFEGTTYFYIKQGIGTMWFALAVLHFWKGKG